MASKDDHRDTRVHWVRSNGFVLGLGVAVAAGFLLPGPGARGGAFHAEVVNNAGVALILFLQGLSLAFEKIRSGAANWRLHLVCQGFTFGVFPLLGLLLHALQPLYWPGEPAAVGNGFLYLCVLPSTISTSVVLTAAARGNTAGALFNAALSNIAGVILTPFLVHLLMRSTGQAQPFGPLLVEITLLTLVPFAFGMVLRRWVREQVDAHKPWVNRISNAVVLFIVYCAFCDAVQEKVWSRYGPLLTLQVVAVVVALFAAVSLLAWTACRGLALRRDDAVAGYFCSVKKTLAMGVPLASLIFGARADLSLILLPIMLYHPLQLTVNGILANRWARQAA